MKALKQLCWLTGIFVLIFSCRKEKSLERGTTPGPSQWEFKDSTAPFKGTMDTAYLVNLGPLTSLVLEGTSTNVGGGDFRMEVFFTGTPAKGTYKNPNVKFTYLISGQALYESVPTNTDRFSVTITDIDSSNVTGTFFGEVETSVGTTTRNITQGSFSAKLSSSSSVPPPATGTGQLMLWSKKACTGTTNISVQVQNKTGSITTLHAAEPGCGASGTATFDLPAGNHTWKAFCGTKDSATGTVLIVASQCLKKEVIFIPAGPAAQLTLATSGGNCANTKTNGTYTVGSALGAANTVEVEVNVTVAGSYNITTPVKNGIWFDGTGSLTTTGLQKITLKGNGTPTTPGANNIAISVGTSNCSFNVNVVSGTSGAAFGWSFTQGSKNFAGTFQIISDFTDNFLGTGKVLWLEGEAGTDTLFDILVHLPQTATKPVAGSYKTQANAFDFSNVTNFNLYIEKLTTRTEIFRSTSPTGVGTNVMTIVITSYDDATKIVEGTFSGKAWDGAGGTVDITNGKFRNKVDL
jgi:hypothetical protein